MIEIKHREYDIKETEGKEHFKENNSQHGWEKYLGWSERYPLDFDKDWKVTFRFCYMEVTVNPDKHNFSEITGQRQGFCFPFLPWDAQPCLVLWVAGLTNASSASLAIAPYTPSLGFFLVKGLLPNLTIQSVPRVWNWMTNQPIPGFFSPTDRNKLVIFFMCL